MILGIQMSKVKIAILETKIERLVEKQKELTERVRSNEKFIAGVGAVATLAVALLGFMGSADASPTTGEWIEKMRDYESQKTRSQPEDSINNALKDMEVDYGCDDPTKQEILLQFSSDEDQKSFRWGHYRCGNRSWFRFGEDRTGEDCWSRHTREENEEFGGKGTWVRCDKLVEGEAQSNNKR